VLQDRCAIYASVCLQRQSPVPSQPSTAEEFYEQAVLLVNQGDANAAIKLLDQALREEPDSAKYLYTRACAWAVKNNADSSVADLQRAISIEPQVRFQAINEPDFQSIREEPAFIDIIEPTPNGA
jgi:tetratricopeptide (TPR) repeat protein